MTIKIYTTNLFHRNIVTSPITNKEYRLRMEEVKTRHKLKILKSETKATFNFLKKSEKSGLSNPKYNTFLINYSI